MINEIATKNMLSRQVRIFLGMCWIQGTMLDDVTFLIATHDLVFLVFALNSNWKIPVGYF